MKDWFFNAWVQLVLSFLLFSAFVWGYDYSLYLSGLAVAPDIDIFILLASFWPLFFGFGLISALMAFLLFLTEVFRFG